MARTVMSELGGVVRPVVPRVGNWDDVRDEFGLSGRAVGVVCGQKRELKLFP